MIKEWNMEESIVYAVTIILLSGITGRVIPTDVDDMYEGGGFEAMLSFGGLCLVMALAVIVSVSFLAFVVDLGWINTLLTVICSAAISWWASVQGN